MLTPLLPQPLLFVAVALTLVVVPVSAQKFALVREGRPQATVVIAENPTENARTAAKEFQEYIRRITGATLPVTNDTSTVQGNLVLIGASKLTDSIPGLDIPKGLTRNLREEGFIIHCAKDRLVLAGNDQEPYYGTRYAVAEMLNRFGVRWFMPGTFGEVVPQTPTLEVGPMQVRERPDFPMRNFWEHARGKMGEECTKWKIRNKLNPRMQDWFGVPGDGSIVDLIPKEEFATHPEWFALGRDGKRDPKMVCMTNPGMIQKFAEIVKARVKAGKRVTSFAPEDGMPRCYCDRCSKMSTAFDGFGTNERDPWPESSTSQEWFYFVNQVMKQVNQEYPEHLLCSNGYANRDIPPELTDFNPAKNLVVMFANICACTLHAYDDPACWMMQRQGQMLRRWCELSDKVWIYNYSYTMLVGKGTLTPMVRRVSRNVPILKEFGIVGFHDQEVCDWAQCGVPTRIVRAALQWNTRANVDAILDDYFRVWFGPAARPMQRYYEALEDAFEKTDAHGHEDVVLNRIYTPALVERLGTYIQEAENRAQTGPEKDRVALERLIYSILLDYTLMETAKRECRFAEAAQFADRICATEEKMNQVTPFMGYWPYQAYGPAWEGQRMRGLARKTDGPAGRLLVALPERALVRKDPFDDGRYERWMQPGDNGAQWRPILTTAGWDNQGFMDKQGHPFKGIMWYRLSEKIPEPKSGETVWLHAPAVVNEVWLWVNGQFAGRRPYMLPWYRPQALDMDITPFIKPGQPNDITFRVLNNIDVWGGSGIYERMFIYAKPAISEEAKAKP